MQALGRVVAIGCSFLMAGCSADWVTYRKIDDEKPVIMVGTEQVAYRSHFAKIDVPELIYSHTTEGCVAVGGANWPPPSHSADMVNYADHQRVQDQTQRIGHAYAAFYRCKGRYGEMELRDRRNRIQAAIMAAASRNCEVYKQFLSTIEADSSFLFGSISTITGVLGGAITGAAPGLSAASGISSGLNAEFSKAFFKDTALPVIYAGIDMKREQVASGIGKRRGQMVGDYPLEEAIADAIRYNGACSAVEGMGHIKHVIAQPVGIEAAQQTISDALDAQALVKISNMDSDKQKAELQRFKENREMRRQILHGDGAKLSSDRREGGSVADAGGSLVGQVDAAIGRAQADIAIIGDEIKGYDLADTDADRISDQIAKAAEKDRIDKNRKVAKFKQNKMMVYLQNLIDTKQGVVSRNSVIVGKIVNLVSGSFDNRNVCQILEKVGQCDSSIDLEGIDGLKGSPIIKVKAMNLASSVDKMPEAEVSALDIALQ